MKKIDYSKIQNRYCVCGGLFSGTTNLDCDVTKTIKKTLC